MSTPSFHALADRQGDGDEAADALALLQRLGASILQMPLRVDGISIYVQTEPGADFLVGRHCGFDRWRHRWRRRGVSGVMSGAIGGAGGGMMRTQGPPPRLHWADKACSRDGPVR